MTLAFLCFASTFIAVFALGLQSLNVNQGHYLAAAGTSLLISAGHIGLYKYMPGADLLQVAAYVAGGVAGITSSMWFHRVAKAWWKRTADRRAATIAKVRAWAADVAAEAGLWSRHVRATGAAAIAGFKSGLDYVIDAVSFSVQQYWDYEYTPGMHIKRASIELCTRCQCARSGNCPRLDCPFFGTDIH